VDAYPRNSGELADAALQWIKPELVNAVVPLTLTLLTFRQWKPTIIKCRTNANSLDNDHDLIAMHFIVA
jgi:hypothetical protein